MLIPIDVGAAVESKPVPAGRYNLQIVEALDTKSQKGAPQFSVSIAIDGHDDAPNLRHFVSLPNPDTDDADKMKFKTLFLKRFLVLFGIPVPSAIDTEKLAMQMAGCKASAELTLSEPDDNGNVYNRLTLPRLREEGSGKQSVPQPPKR